MSHCLITVHKENSFTERFFFFADFEQLHKHTYMRQNPRLCKYPHKHSDLGLKSKRQKEKTYM